MQNITMLAKQVNSAFISQDAAAGRLSSMLYNEVLPSHQGGQALVNLDSDDCHSVGVAFATIACLYNFGDEDMNSVAAENAYYCLSRSFIESDNKQSLPYLFTMLYARPRLLKDKFIAGWCSLAEKRFGMSIGRMLRGNPYTDPDLQSFRDQAVGFMKDAMYFMISKFYDVKLQQFLIPTESHALFPQDAYIDKLITEVQQSASYSSGNFIAECEEHFISVYKECEDSLKSY